jgi:hypothetical protein
MVKVATVGYTATVSRAASGQRPPITAEVAEVLEGWESMALARNVVMVAKVTFYSRRTPLRCVMMGTMEVALAEEAVEGRTIHLVLRVLED